VSDRFTTAAVGVLDYNFGNFELQLTSALTRVDSGLPREVTRPQAANELAIATFNVENLSPVDPPAKFARLADLIVDNLRAPDIVALEEIQDNDGPANTAVTDATLTLQQLIAAIQATGGPAYQFRQIDPVDDQDGGQPGGNIRVGFLFNPLRVSFVDRPGGTATAATAVVAAPGGPQLSLSPGRIDPTNPAFNNSRKPLAGEFMFQGHRLFVIGNHWNSKGGDDPLFGRFQPPVLSSEAQRMQQAEVVRGFVASILALDADAKVVVLGDLNDFEFSPPVTLLKTAGLHDLVEMLPENERYTYVFEGNSQVLDHILVSSSLTTAVEYDIVHTNAEFAVQTSDHEPEVARLYLPPLATEITKGIKAKSSKLEFDRKAKLWRGTLTITNVGKTPIDGPLQVVLDDLDDDATLVNAAGTHAGDPYLTADLSLPPKASVTLSVRFTVTGHDHDHHHRHKHRKHRHGHHHHDHHHDHEPDIDYDVRVFTGAF
jgi:hypothetical protein